LINALAAGVLGVGVAAVVRLRLATAVER